MHPAIPKSLLPDQFLPGLQLDENFGCKKPLDICHYFSILGDGILEEIYIQEIQVRDGGQFTFWLGGFTVQTGLLIRTCLRSTLFGITSR